MRGKGGEEGQLGATGARKATRASRESGKRRATGGEGRQKARIPITSLGFSLKPL